MKKSLLALILAVALVAPAFAAKGDMSVNAKLGLGVSNNLNTNLYPSSGPEILPDDIQLGYSTEMPVSVGAEFFYGVMDNLSVGLGVNYGFDSKTKTDYIVGSAYPDKTKYKVGTTNIYLAVKPEAKIESDIFSSIYLIGQIGLSIPRAELEYSRASLPSIDTKNGLYLGLGIGTTIKDCVIVEIVCSSAKSTWNADWLYGDGVDVDVQYTATTINVGYKFTL